MQMYFITSNKHKFQELKSALLYLEQLDIDLSEIQEIDAQKVIAAKLQEAFIHHEGPFIVEDTSLYLECLNGLPGPLIKWFLKSIGNEGLFYLTEKLENNKAIAKTIIGYARTKDDIQFFEGVINGQIVAHRGEHGFGWDAIFQPEGQNKTFAEMIHDEKNAQEMNMRQIAVLKLQEFLRGKSI